MVKGWSYSFPCAQCLIVFGEAEGCVTLLVEA